MMSTSSSSEASDPLLRPTATGGGTTTTGGGISASNKQQQQQQHPEKKEYQSVFIATTEEQDHILGDVDEPEPGVRILGTDHGTPSDAGSAVVMLESETEDSSGGGSSKNFGRVLLFIVSFLYGTLNVSLRKVYALPDPPSASVMSTVRGWLAVICFGPFLVPKIRRHQQPQQHEIITTPINTSAGSTSSSDDDHIVESEYGEEQEQDGIVSSSTTTSLRRRRRPFWWVAFELALLNFGAQALVNVGLLWIASARASFLTETSVVITPIISAVLGHPVKWTVWIACGIAMGGLVILSDKTGEGVGHFGFGDILTLMGAVCWSMYVFRLSQFGAAYDEVYMQASKTFLLACLYSVWYIIAQLLDDVSLWPGYTNIVAWLLLFYSAFGPGALADVIQQKGQSTIQAAEANVIIAMEPVFTSILGFILLGEAMTIQEYLGGGMLIIAAILATR